MGRYLRKRLKSQQNLSRSREKKQFEAFQSFDFVGKTELKRLEDIFSQNQLNNFDRLKGISEIESSIEMDNLIYSTSGNNHNVNNYSLPVVLRTNKHPGNLEGTRTTQLKKNAPIIEDISDISQNHTSSRSSGLLISAANPVKNTCLTTPNLRKRVPKQLLKILLILLTQLQAGSTYNNHL